MQRKFNLTSTVHPERHASLCSTLYVPPQPTLPPSADLRGYNLPVYDQGELGSCTAFAIAKGLREFLELQAGRPATPLSALWLYRHERMAEQDVPDDAGANLVDGLWTLTNSGCAPDGLWPYDVAKFADAPPAEADAAAAAFKVERTMHFVDGDVDGVKHCLGSGFPVAVGLQFYAAFQSEAVAANGQVPMPTEGEQCLGGHAVLVVGFTGDGKFIVRNSWGPDWGDRGHFYIDEAYLRQYGTEFWTARLT